MQHFFRTAAYAKFVEIARNHFNRALSCQEKLRPLAEKLFTLSGDEATELEIEHLTPIKDELQNDCLITIVFSALALEGYIYDYAARNLSDDFVDSHLDKLDVVSKWVVIPKLVTGKEFPKSTRGFQLLKQLIANRNFIAHNKSASVFVIDDRTSTLVHSGAAKRIHDFGGSLFEKAREAISAIEELALIMETLDSNEEASYFLSARVGKWKEHLEEYGF